MRTVTYNTIFLTGASLIQKTLSFIYFTLLARTFTASEIGAYSYSLAFTTIFSILIDGGLTPVLIRHTARHPAQARSFLKKIFTYKIVFLCFTLVAMIFAVFGVDAAFETRYLILGAVAVMMVDSLNLSVFGVLRGTQNLIFESVGVVCAQLTSLACVIATVVFHLPIVWAIIGLGVGSVVNASIGFFGLSRINRAASSAVRESAPITLSFRDFMRESLPFALAGIFARGYSYLDLLLLGSFANFAAAGTYSIANKTTFVFQFIPLSLSAVLYPAFSKLLVSNDRVTIRNTWWSSERYLIVMAGMITMVLISLRVEILGFFGAEHVRAANVLILLALSLVFSFMSYPVGALLNASGFQKLQTAAMGCTLVINAVLNVVLIPRLGGVGAATSALIGNCVLFSIGAFFVEGRVEKMPWKRLLDSSVRIFLCGLIAGGVVILTQSFFQNSVAVHGLRAILPIGVRAAFGVCIYGILLIAFGVFSIAEARIKFFKIYEKNSSHHT